MDWLGDNVWAVWLGAAVVLGAAEMLSLDLVLGMLALGALAGMVASLVGLPVVGALAVAGVVSVGLLGVARPSLAARLHGGPDLQLGHAKLVGTRGVVLEPMSATSVGRVRLGGEVWSAQPYDDTLALATGETVEVLEIRGATAYVHPVPQLEN